MPIFPESNPDFRPQGPIACVLTDASQLTGAMIEALAASGAKETHCITLCGEESELQSALESAGGTWAPTSLFSFEIAPHALATEHHLCDRLEERLGSARIEAVWTAPQGPAAGGSLESVLRPSEIGTGIIGSAALSGVPRRLVILSQAETQTFDSRNGAAWIRARRERSRSSGRTRPTVTAVISTWNKCSDVRANLLAIRAQALPFDEVVVVDNASSDDTAQTILTQFPEVRLVVMPHSEYGACETFNIGFSSASCEQIAILDDDVVLPTEWLAKTSARFAEEPETTAIVSTKIVEPGTPESYRNSPEICRERYMSTFRGCASLAKRDVLARAGFYDERLFIYGNERDLTCRVLNLGYRVLQYPDVETFHKTPFGIKMGKRSLYYHARNAFLGMLKYAPLMDLIRLPFLAVFKVLLRGGKKEVEGEVADATGTIGIGRSVRETPGAWIVLLKAGMSVLYNLPYCLARREACKAPDFELPIE
ncbi:MAG: GT2 family glycosyltransferase [Planctomycetota bacterium]|jgi:GT2 family glycosyltransferase